MFPITQDRWGTVHSHEGDIFSLGTGTLHETAGVDAEVRALPFKLKPAVIKNKMKSGLVLGIDGAGKTLLMRQLSLLLSRNRRGVVGKLVALAQSASCMAADVVNQRSHTSSPEDASSNGAASISPANVIHQALHYANMYNQPLAAHFKHSGSSVPAEEAHVDRDTQPTIGVEHTPISIDGKAFTLCEIGGQLLPMWKAYFDDCDFWVFVIDISSPSHVAAAAIEFFNIMTVEAMRRKPKLLLLNKIDASFTLDDSLLRAYLCLDRLMTDAFSTTTSSGPMHVVKISSLSGENVDTVLKWISQRSNSASNTSGHGGMSSGPSLAQVATGQSGRVQSLVKSEKQRVHPVSH